MPDPMGAPPPVPGPGMNAAGPSFAGLAGAQQQAPQPPATPGASQVGAGAMKMALEIDQALKLLAQAMPQLGPWVEQTVMGLRDQLGQAMAAGVPTNPTPTGSNMPDGSQNL